MVAGQPMKSVLAFRMQRIKEALASNTITTISLFSGAGGLDIGAIYAGAKIIWANDMKKEAVASYKKNIFLRWRITAVK